MSKKIYCLLIALLMVLTVSCVSAAEDIDDSIAAVDDEVEVQTAIDDVSLESDDDADVLSDGETGDADSELDINAEVSEYGNVEINVTANKTATGNVTVKIMGSDNNYVDEIQDKIENGSLIIGDMGFNLPKGNYTINATYSGDSTFKATSALTTLKIAKDVTELNVTTVITEYGILNINATVDKAATGNVTFRIVREGAEVDPSKDVNKTIEDGVAEFSELFYVEKGNYTVYVTYLGDENYYLAYSGPIGVEANKTLLNPNVTNCNVTANTVNITVDLGAPASGNVSVVYPSGHVDNVTIVDGKITFVENFEEGGNVTLVLDYDGDENYYGFYEYNVDFFIKYDADLKVNTTVNKYGHIVIVANVNKTATGNITFIISTNNTDENPDGDIVANVTKEIVNGTASYDENTPFDKGLYKIYVIYSGDELFGEGGNYLQEANVNRTAPVLTIDLGTLENNITVKVTADNATVAGNVTIEVFDNEGNAVANVTKEMVNGVVDEFNFTGIAPGDYKVVASFLGSDDFYQAFNENVTEVRISGDMDLNVTVDEYGIITAVANVTKGATGNVTFIIKNNATGDIVGNLTIAIVNDTAKYEETAQYAKGNYSIEAYYSGDDTYSDMSVFGEAEINKEYINVTEKVTVVGNQATIVFTFPADATGNVTVFYLNSGSNETLPIVNGTVTVDQTFDNGNQTILLTYDGDKNYYGVYEEYVDFFVKTSSFIKVDPVTVVYQNTAKVVVTLTDNNDGKGNNPIANATVVITLNGKQYTGVTDAKGIATISVPAKLVPKAYAATVSYAGTNTTVGENETFKFTVTKAKAKITAKNKKFKKSKKVKKYKVVLKDNKGKAIKKVKLTLKIKGKKAIKTKTNKKGKAVFKIKKLTKKGKFKAKVTFKGNKYFKKVTKKAKITIK